MRKTKLLAALVLAASATAAFAAGSTSDQPFGSDPAIHAPLSWTAGSLVLQGELEREALDRAGFPQYND